jgi:predicted MFS family arabinose efflux permease
LTEFRALLRQRALYLPLLTECLSTGLFATFSAFIVVIAVQSQHLQTTVASVLMSIEGGVFIITVFAAGRLIKMLSQLQLYVSSVSVVVGGLFALAFAKNFTALVGSTVVLGLGLGLINLVVSSRIARIDGEKGKIVGLFSAAIGVGISLGPMSGGVIGSWFGTSAIFLAFVPLFLILMVGAIWLDLRHRGQSTAVGSAEDAVTIANDSIGEFHEFAEGKTVH